MQTDSVKTFFSGKSIFVTGATGFIGKVLIEKILRSCPGVDKIYILVRSKKGKSPEERVKDITSVELFDTLKKQYPDAIEKKLRPILGDASQLCLGLSEADKKELIDNVSIIYHAAASVRFNDPLKDAVLLNTRGTREVAQLALEMKRLEVFVHVSTTYCNTDKKVVEERLYPPHADWKNSIEIAENINEYDLEVLTPKYIDALPNTYTFTKSLAEHVVVDMCENKIPVVVFRPSIVIASWNDPIPGWLDNFNGPAGLEIGAAKGLIRTMYLNPDLKADLMPVDLIVKALLIATWQKGTAPVEEKLIVDFYNGSNNNVRNITFNQMMNFLKKLFWEAPFDQILWYPSESIATQCKYWNYIRVIFLHLLPAILIDLVLRLMSKKPTMVKIQRRIFIANMALQYFLINQWTFLNDKVFTLDKKLLPSELDEFGFYIDKIDPYEFYRKSFYNNRRYVLKEKVGNVERAKRNFYKMYLLDKFVNFILFALIFWMLVYKMNVLAIIANKISNCIGSYL